LGGFIPPAQDFKDRAYPNHRKDLHNFGEAEDLIDRRPLEEITEDEKDDALTKKEKKGSIPVQRRMV
jgi:hypothetical protein